MRLGAKFESWRASPAAREKLEGKKARCTKRAGISEKNKKTTMQFPVHQKRRMGMNFQIRKWGRSGQGLRGGLKNNDRGNPSEKEVASTDPSILS